MTTNNPLSTLLASRDASVTVSEQAIAACQSAEDALVSAQSQYAAPHVIVYTNNGSGYEIAVTPMASLETLGWQAVVVPTSGEEFALESWTGTEQLPAGELRVMSLLPNGETSEVASVALF